MRTNVKGGQRVRTLQIPLDSGEAETLITNAGEGTLEYEAFKDLYHKRRMEPENFSGRLADTVRQDFYAVMTVSDMPAHFVRKADREVKQARAEIGNKYEYPVNVNHAAGVYKDKLIGVVIEGRRGVRRRLMEELVWEIERRVVPVRLNRKVPRKDCSRKARFHHNHKSNC